MKIADNVRNILANHPATRNSDRELLIQYMQNEGMSLSPEQREIFRRMASPETIRRCRQKFQEDGRYIATDRIRRARRFKSYEVQQRITQTPIEKVPHLLSIFGDDRTIS